MIIQCLGFGLLRSACLVLILLDGLPSQVPQNHKFVINI